MLGANDVPSNSISSLHFLLYHEVQRVDYAFIIIESFEGSCNARHILSWWFCMSLFAWLSFQLRCIRTYPCLIQCDFATKKGLIHNAQMHSCCLHSLALSKFSLSVRNTVGTNFSHVRFFFLKMVWAIPSSLEISTHVQSLSFSNKTLKAWTWRSSVAAMGLPAHALCWYSSLA